MMGRLIALHCVLAWRRKTDTAASLMFFLLVTMLFPLVIGPEPRLLKALGPGMVWVAALLAALMPLDRLLEDDLRDGVLDQWRLSSLPPAGFALAKAIGHWLTTGLPLCIAVFPVTAMFTLQSHVSMILVAGLVPGTMVLSLLGVVIAVLLLNARHAGMLLPLILIPLLLPIMMIGAMAGEQAALGLSAAPYIMVMLAMLCVALPLCAFTAGAALNALAPQG